MTRVLFCVLPERGHVNPYIAPAQALVDLGADVAFWANADLRPQLARAGLAFVGDRRPLVSESRGAVFAERLRDPVWLRRWVRALLLDDSQLAPISEAIARFQPDVVAIDPLLYAAAIAAHSAGLPWAAISNSLNPALPDTLDSELLRTVHALAPERAALFARHGMRASFRGCDVLSPHLTIAFATEALVGSVAGVHLVGPSLPRRQRGDEVPWDAPPGPFVYMSFGSQAYWQPALFRRVIEATAQLGVQLVLSVSDLDLAPLPSHVIALHDAPQLEVLRRASAFVTHGGANSVMEALAFGVPLLIAPLCNDQFHQAYFVEQRGVGLVNDLSSVDDTSRALRQLLTDGPIRARVREVARSYARDGAGEAARLVSALAAGSRRATAS